MWIRPAFAADPNLDTNTLSSLTEDSRMRTCQTGETSDIANNMYKALARLKSFKNCGISTISVNSGVQTRSLAPVTQEPNPGGCAVSMTKPVSSRAGSISVKFINGTTKTIRYSSHLEASITDQDWLNGFGENPGFLNQLKQQGACNGSAPSGTPGDAPTTPGGIGS